MLFFAALAFSGPLIPGLDRTAQLDRQRLAVAILGLARGDADPAFGNAIFLDIIAHPVLETDANAALQLLHVEMGAARIGGEAVWRCVAGIVRCVGHGRAIASIQALIPAEMSASIMVAALGDFQPLFFCRTGAAVNEPMLACDPP